MDFWSIIYPPMCLSCHKDGEWLCHNCLAKIIFIKSNFCPGCGRISDKGIRHGKCARLNKINQLLVCAYYRDPLDKIIVRAKYKYYHHFSSLAADWLKNLVSEYKIDLKNTVIVPVPSDPARMRKYGYHFAHKLAKDLAKKLKLPVEDILIKIKSTEAQVGKSRSSRMKQLKDIIKLRNDLNYKKVILVDDVFTTGTTLNYSAQAIKNFNSKIKVIGVVVARG